MNYDNIFKEGSFLQVSTYDVCNNIIRSAYKVGKQPKSDYYTGKRRCKKNGKRKRRGE